MNKTIENIHKTRQFLLAGIESLDVATLNKVPAGFSNNIIWNVGHLVAAQQSVCYVRAGLRHLIDTPFFEAYKPGSKPEAWVDEQAISQVKKLLFTSLDDLAMHYEQKLFDHYQPLTTRYGAVINNIDDAIAFMPYHEGLHGGYILALKRIIGQQA